MLIYDIRAFLKEVCFTLNLKDLPVNGADCAVYSLSKKN